jgi:predicted nucleic acid-binding protein
MSGPILLDTGPLISFLHERQEHHGWAISQFERLPFPFLTCEAVITEAAHLLYTRAQLRPEVMLELLRTGAIRIDYQIQSEVRALQSLTQRYDNVPMDLADACLVRMYEMREQAKVLTLDSDFFVFRTESGGALEVVPQP